jgi:hypothetical protein
VIAAAEPPRALETIAIATPARSLITHPYFKQGD